MCQNLLLTQTKNEYELKISIDNPAAFSYVIVTLRAKILNQNCFSFMGEKEKGILLLKTGGAYGISLLRLRRGTNLMLTA